MKPLVTIIYVTVAFSALYCHCASADQPAIDCSDDESRVAEITERMTEIRHQKQQDVASAAQMNGAQANFGGRARIANRAAGYAPPSSSSVMTGDLVAAQNDLQKAKGELDYCRSLEKNAHGSSGAAMQLHPQKYSTYSDTATSDNISGNGLASF